MSGKWHVGDARVPAPGFEFWYAHRYGGGPYFDAPIWREGREASEPRYFTHAVTEEALNFLNSRDRDRPFYLQVNYTAPHDPWIDSHPKEYLDCYEGCEFDSVPREQPHPWQLNFEYCFEDPGPSLTGYCASLTAVDEGFGRLLQSLDEQGIADNTVVIYMSDNGFSCGHHGVWGKGNGTSPLNLWQNSVLVPFVVRVPKGARGTSRALVSAAAVHPTVCELAGISPDPDRWAGSQSVADLLLGRTDTGQPSVVVHSEYGGARMITDGRWKLICRFDGPDELYDLVNDPGEQTDLIDLPAHGQLRLRLKLELDEWFATHERADESAFERKVTGFGQVHPLSRGFGDDRTYESGAED